MSNTSREADAVDVEELYRPPVADPAPVPQVARNLPFHVVSSQKFLILFVATLGAYQVYWFFAHWRQQRDATGQSLSPFWRAIFSVLFTHKLFRQIAAGAAAARQPAPAWNPGHMATLYVVLTLGEKVVSRLSDVDGFSGLEALAVALNLGTGYPLWLAQRASNAASRDPEGSGNTRLTPLNYVFIVLGSLLWMLVIVGLWNPDLSF